MMQHLCGRNPLRLIQRPLACQQRRRFFSNDPRSQRRRRVVVTGLGAVSPLGLTFVDSWRALLAQTSGVTTLEEALREQYPNDDQKLSRALAWTQHYPSQVAAPVRGFANHAVLDKSINARTTARHTQFALVAVREALEQAALLEELQEGNNNSSNIAKDDHSTSSDVWSENPWTKGTTAPTPTVLNNRAGVIWGCGMGSMPDIIDSYSTLDQQGYRRVSPHFVPKVLPNSASGRLSMEYGLCGPSTTISTACAAASHAIGEAYRWIQDPACGMDVIVTGGSEACIEPLALAGFGRLRALSTQSNDQPQHSSRPFDQGRDGFVMAEGAAALVLEAEEHALARGAVILATVEGFGSAADAHHVTAPHPHGLGARAAMMQALQYDAGLARRVQYVNAHATATPVGDDIEARVIRQVLCSPYDHDDNDNDNPLYVSSTKGATGHLLGAAGAIESAFTVQALVDQVLPPTLNLTAPVDIDDDNHETKHDREMRHVTETMPAKLDYAMNNSFGFGGTNASLLFRKWTEEEEDDV